MKTLTPVIALLAAGCAAGSSGGDPIAQPHTPNQHNIRLAHRAEHYLKQNFRGTTWLSDVKRIKVRYGEMFIVTDIYPDSDANYPAQRLCGAMRFWPPAPSTVHIVSTTGKWIGC